MNCQQCGKALPAGAMFCMQCGQRVSPAATAGAAPVMQPVSVGAPMYPGVNPFDPAQAQRRRNATVLAILVALALVTAGVFGLRSVGYLTFGAGRPDGSSLIAPAKSGVHALQAEGSRGVPPLAQAATRLEMPADVLAWLKHLERCEKKKQTIDVEQESRLMEEFTKDGVLPSGTTVGDWTDPNSDPKLPTDTLSDHIGEMKKSWQDLGQYFESVPPPAECKSTAESFDRGIREIPGMMSDIQSVLGQSKEDSTAAQTNARKLKQTSKADIDNFFSLCDRQVADICQKYGVRKWFTIRADDPMGSSLGAPVFGGG